MGGASVVLIHRGENRTVFTLDENRNSLTVGRKAGCDIQINDVSVSGLHGRFFFEHGTVYYLDLNSTNGSFIGNVRTSGEKTALSDGSVVSVAGVISEIKLKVALHNVNSCEDESTDGISENTVFISNTSGQSGGGKDIVKESIKIGRDPSCDIVLTQINASRFHAKIEIRGDGVYIDDNSSTNGTFVNGTRITKPCRITVSDSIHIAGVRFRLENGTLVADDDHHGLPVYIRNLTRRVFVKGREKILLDKISLTLEPNEFVAIMGGSGAGKSTLMNVLCGKTGTYEGSVAYDRFSTDNRGAYKSVIGFAPQYDILYDDLTLQKLLFYSAKLKMPDDTGMEEYRRRVKDAIQKVQLEGHENTLIGSLSGGQRKRASIAIELLSNPRLFFLDEPTSGLDPSTERGLMRMLKDMARDNKTIVAVTHITQNISLCDKLIILGRGGKLCFFGTPAEACSYFEVTDFVDIYDKINTAPDEWQQKFLREYSGDGDFETLSPDSKKSDNPNRNSSGWSQFLVLSGRYVRLITGDIKRLLLLLLQAPVLGMLLMMVSGSSADDGAFAYSSTAKSMLFSLTCAAFWIGMLNSIQEICKERAIYEREKMSAVRTLPYIASKIAVIGLLSIIQSFMLVSVVRFFSGTLPENSFDIPPFFGYFLTTCLTTLCAACLGLAVSAVSPNPDRAMAIAPLILLPQILFSGVVFELTGFFNFISNAIPCKLSMQNFGVLTDFNSLEASAEVSEKSLNAMYSVTNSMNLYGTWAGLAASAFLYIIIFAVALKLKES